MEVKKVVTARVLQLAKAPTNLGWLPDLFKEIGLKYEFQVVPTPSDLWRADPNGKADFRHGRLGANIINTFAMFNDGFVVDTTTSTDIAELFLNDLMQLLKAKVPYLEAAGKPFYLSQLEVSLKLGGFGKLLDSIGNQIFKLLAGYEILGVGPYALSALHLAQDPLGKVGPKLSGFNIERRIEVPYADNLFFAQAPLKTHDLKAMLETLEGVLAGI